MEIAVGCCGRTEDSLSRIHFTVLQDSSSWRPNNAFNIWALPDTTCLGSKDLFGYSLLPLVLGPTRVLKLAHILKLSKVFFWGGGR